jgi:hypothetical protein
MVEERLGQRIVIDFIEALRLSFQQRFQQWLRVWASTRASYL